VVNPDEYVVKFGADTLRLYVMFLGPMDAYPDFRDSGIEGMQRFVNRLWKLFQSSDRLGSDKRQQATNNRIISKLHQTIKKVTEDMYNFKYNTAIASLMELVNELAKYKALSTEYLGVLARLIAPFAPHLAEEVWVEILKQPFSIHTAKWPDYDSSLIVNDVVSIIIQVNGKLRGILNLESGVSENKEKVIEIAKKDEKTAKWLENTTISKVIYIPGRLINFVVK
jgi:leucyl-tRNA synthetase